MPTFGALQAGYQRDLLAYRTTDPAQVSDTARRIIKGKSRFMPVQEKLGIPAVWMMASFEREASSNFNLSPAQGDPWRRKSVNEPRGLGPYSSWEESALEAYRYDKINNLPPEMWTWAFGCYKGEGFNGFGFRNHGVHSAYLWAGTNLYTIGMYVSDGSWRAGVKDPRVGIVPVMRMLNSMDPTLHFVDPFPIPGVTPPDPIVEHERDDGDLQKALNFLNYGPLLVDGNFGRHTRDALVRFQTDHKLDADGIPGPKTWSAIDEAMKGLPVS